MKEINRMVRDERTYIESIGKSDKETVRDALAEKGANTILRLCVGVSGKQAPRRALGYFASAIATQEHYFPEAELQFVYPLLAASMTNGVDLKAGHTQMNKLDLAVRQSFPRRFRKDSPEAGNIKSFFDSQIADDYLEASVAEELEANPGLAEKIQASAARRGSDCIPYVAAHILLHDTNPVLAPLHEDEYAGTAARVISIGAQSDRPFYALRMAYKEYGSPFLPNDEVATGQIFTKHVLSPHISCREGEPLLKDEAFTAEHKVASVQRDLEYLDKVLSAENERYQAMTTPVVHQSYCSNYTTLEFV